MAIVLFPVQKSIEDKPRFDREVNQETVTSFPARGEHIEGQLHRFIETRLRKERRWEMNPNDLLEEFIEKNRQDWSFEKLQLFLDLRIAGARALHWSSA